MKNIGLTFLLVMLMNSLVVANSSMNNMKSTENETDTVIATFAGGCFWCTEAIFETINGVSSVQSGYSGGEIINPTYREVTGGKTGHAEAIQVYFDPSVISYIELLEIFFKTHDPTTLNRQGADVGTQYRSAVFYHSDQQKQDVVQIMSDLNKAEIWSNPIVTELTEYKNFYVAEEYHQEYFSNNPGQGYCRVVIQPKIEKFKKVFSDKLK